MRAQFILSEMAIGLRRNLSMTLAVVITVAISLALFGQALLIRSQINEMKGYWYDKVEVSVSLCLQGDSAENCGGRGITVDQREAIQRALEALPQVEKLYYESQEEAYEHFKEQFKDSPDIVRNVTPDQLPESFRVKLKDPTRFDVVSSAVAGQPGVESVQDQRRLLAPFFDVLDGFRKAGLVFAGVSIIAAMILISNTIRLAAFSRRRETSIMRLVGASNLYIKLPFLLEGALAGLLGGAFAALFLFLSKWTFIDPVLRERLTFTSWIGTDTVAWTALFCVVLGVVLSSVAAFVTLSLSKAIRA